MGNLAQHGVKKEDSYETEDCFCLIGLFIGQ